MKPSPSPRCVPWRTCRSFRGRWLFAWCGAIATTAALIATTPATAFNSKSSHERTPGCLDIVVCALALTLLGVVTGASARRRVEAEVETDTEGHPRAFRLVFGNERTALEPGRSWTQVDHYKWVTRGVIEPPQSFAVHPDGSVDLNGDTFRPGDPGAAEALAEQINKHHQAVAPRKAASVTHTAAAASGPQQVQYRVRVDHLGHLLIAASRGADRTETGLRGLEHFAADGWMRRPRTVHIDPLQRYVEIDETRYECTPDGAQALETALNSRYAPPPQSLQGVAVEVRENPAAATGFDIHFWIVRAGTRFEIKGHLSQDKLDILQDHDKCDLLKPGILLRISPPFLYIRRRRPDGGEEHIPGLPDIKYRAITAAELQRVLNHPLIRATDTAAGPPEEEDMLPPDLVRLRVVRRPYDAALLWLELHRLGGKPLERALTHHNILELKAGGFFREGWEIDASVDNRELAVDHAAGHVHERLPVEPGAPDTALERASELLSAALREPIPVAATSVPTGEPTPAQPDEATASQVTRPVPPPPLPAASPTAPSPAPPGPREGVPPTPPPAPPANAAPPPSAPPVTPPAPSTAPDRPAPAGIPTPPKTTAPPPVAEGIFRETDPRRINESIFAQLAGRMHIAVQDVLLSLPRVFEDRRFEILDFSGTEIGSVLQLRGGSFYGFYLTHLGESRMDLVYACHGTHLEWGTDKCAMQPTIAAETLEFRHPALLGLAQNAADHFVFIVEPGYRDWIKPHENACAAACAHFLTVEEWARQRDAYPLIWPTPTTA